MRKGSIYSLHPGFARGDPRRVVGVDAVCTLKPLAPFLLRRRPFVLTIRIHSSSVLPVRAFRLVSDDASMEAMFSGPKAALRPLYDRLLELAFKFGKEVRVALGKTIVPLYRKHVFAQVKPAARTRIHLA